MVSWCQIQFLEYYVQTGSSMKEANLSKTYTCHIFTKHLQQEDQIPQKKISCNNVILWQTGGGYFPAWALDLSTYVMCATLCNTQVSIAQWPKNFSLCVLETVQLTEVYWQIWSLILLLEAKKGQMVCVIYKSPVNHFEWGKEHDAFFTSSLCFWQTCWCSGQFHFKSQ